MQDIKSIIPLDDTYAIIEEFTTSEELNAIPEKIKHFLQFFESFEPFCYYVITDKQGNNTVTMCDSINGDVLTDNIPLDQFIKTAIEYAAKETAGE